MKPEFICIGAHKAGTSWLYEMISQHPECSLPPVKELHYFDRSAHYPSPDKLSEDKLIKRLCNLKWLLERFKDIFRLIRDKKINRFSWWWRYYFSNYSDNWYLSLFKNEQLITGDITPSYAILDESDVIRMKQLMPDVKIIFLIRDPVSRAWSMLRYKSLRSLSNKSEQDYVNFKARVEQVGQVLRSDYLRTLKLFEKHFGGQLMLCFYDAVKYDPERLLDEVFDFIGCQNGYVPVSMCKKVNKSTEVAMPDLYRDYLVEKYSEDISGLAARYGSYARVWNSRKRGGAVDETSPNVPAVYL